VLYVKTSIWNCLEIITHLRYGVTVCLSDRLILKYPGCLGFRSRLLRWPRFNVYDTDWCICHATSPVCMVAIRFGRFHEHQRKTSANYYYMAGIYYYDWATFVNEITKGFSVAFIVTRLPYLRNSLMLGDVTTRGWMGTGFTSFPFLPGINGCDIACFISDVTTWVSMFSTLN